MKNFLKIFTNNWSVKLVCLILAFLIYLYVSFVGSIINSIPGGLSLEIRNIPENYVAISDTSIIEVKILASKNIWNKISSETIKAYIDLNGLKDGTHELQVKIESLISDVEISDYSPKKVLVRIEPKISKKIPVKTKIEGAPANNMTTGEIKINPEEIEIMGPQNTINNILEATAIVRLDGENEGLVKKVSIVALDDKNEKITNVSFNPSEVEVNIPIIKADTIKTVGIKVLTSGNLASGFWISDIIIDPISIAITGDADKIKNINYIETKNINIEGLSKNIEKYVDFNLPSGINLIDPKQALYVKLEISKSIVSKQIQAKINSKNLNNTLKIENIDPSIINVNITGEEQVIANIKSEDIIVNIDLANVPSIGTYYVDLKDSMFDKPIDISIVSFVPSSIKYIIGNK